MLSYRLGTVNDFHWEFKPVLSYSKPHTFSTFRQYNQAIIYVKPLREKNSISSIHSMGRICEFKIEGGYAMCINTDKGHLPQYTCNYSLRTHVQKGMILSEHYN